MESTPLGVRKGAWSEEEDLLLRRCIEKFGEGNWHEVPPKAGLNRCRKSCRLRWLNYLRPNIKRGDFTSDEVDLIIRLHRWSLIAGRLPGRTGNDVKNYWNTHLRIKPVGRGKAEKTTSITKVIKPRPRRLSSNLVWFSGNNNTSINIAGNNTTTDQSRDSLMTKPSPTSPLKVDEIAWWDNMVIDNGVLTWSMGGSDEELITGLWTDEIPTGVHSSESYVQDGKNNLNHFSADVVDLWDLL